MSSHDLKEAIRQTKAFLEAEEKTYGAYRVPDISSQEQQTSSGQSSKHSVDAPSPSPESEKDKSSAKKSAVQAGNSEESSESGSGSASTTTLQEAATLDELRELCLHSDALRTDLGETSLVFGTGNPDADIMLIGEAPGYQEDKQGEPFVGKAGQLLNKILAAISFERDEVYIANILKHRPPNNRDPHPEERERSLPFLYRQIELVNPLIILCLGRIAAQTLLNTTAPMKSLRGRFHPFHNDIELLVTFHPAALLRNPAWKRDTWEDVKMLRKQYDNLTVDRS